MIKAFIFDIDGTLYDYDAAHAQAYGILSEEACRELQISAEEFQALYSESCRRQVETAGAVCAAVHNRLIRFQLILEKLHRPLALARKMERLYWHSLLDAMEITPGAAESLAAVHRAGCLVGIGTNMTADWQFEKLERLNLLDSVDFLVSSEEANTEKPEPGLFLLCAEKAGYAPCQCAYVGDSWKHDVLGARQAGMLPVWLCRNPEQRVRHLEEAESGPVPVPILETLSDLSSLLPALSTEQMSPGP